jgi:hypothetical protein
MIASEVNVLPTLATGEDTGVADTAVKLVAEPTGTLVIR